MQCDGGTREQCEAVSVKEKTGGFFEEESLSRGRGKGTKSSDGNGGGRGNGDNSGSK